MLSRSKRWCLGILSLGLVVACAGGIYAGGNYLEKIPDFTLKDPAAGSHTGESLLKDTKKGLVVIVTIPNAKHGPMQSRWQSKLMKKNWPEGMKMVLLEDLSQAGMVKEKAEKGMKDGFKPGKEPLLLVDETGEVRRTFGVGQDMTVCLIFDPKGNLVHAEDGQSSIESTEPSVDVVQRVQKILGKMAK